MEIDHLLDYGCGRNTSLFKNLDPERSFKYQAYDPGWPEFSDPPVPAQMVACCDVLEHIEPDCLEDVLDHLVEMTEYIAFLSVCTVAANKTLPDGRNAHLIQQPMEWWLPKIWDRFKIQSLQVMSDAEFYVIAYSE